MKNARLLSIVAGVITLALFYFYFSRPDADLDKETLAAKAPEPQSVQDEVTTPDLPRTAQSSPAPQAPEEDGEDEDSPEIREVLPLQSEEDILTALAETNLMSSSDLTHLVERLKSSDAEIVAGIFQKQMDQSDLSQASQRNRVMLVADAWRSEALLPMWKDLALRASEANMRNKDAERTAMSVEEPNELTRGIELEILTAVGNLGILGARQPEARETLHQLISYPDPAIHTLFIRERAFYALKEADVTASVVTLKNLASDDPLRARLKRR